MIDTVFGSEFSRYVILESQEADTREEKKKAHIRTHLGAKKNSIIELKPPSGTNSGVNRINPFLLLLLLLFDVVYEMMMTSTSLSTTVATAMTTKKVINICENYIEYILGALFRCQKIAQLNSRQQNTTSSHHLLHQR